MPLATDLQFIKTYGKLPWWRGPAHFRKLLKRSAEASSAIEGVRIKTFSNAVMPKGKTGVQNSDLAALRQKIEQIIHQHPDWGKEQIKVALKGAAVLFASAEKIFTQADQPELNRELTPYERKVDFGMLDSETKKLTSQGVDRVKKLLAESRDKLLSLIANRYKTGMLTSKFVLDLELRGLGRLIPTLRETLGAAFRLGQREARKELKKTLAEQESLVKPYQVKLDVTGLPPEKALEFFERKAVLWGADIRQPLLSDVKNILLDGIKQGTSLRELMDRIGLAFLPWLGDEDQMLDAQVLMPYRLETLVRTNITEALNEGRKAQFQPAVDDGFVIGLQFSAILDGRTTPVCTFLDKKVFRPNSPEVDRLSPPRQFNCRSVWVPVTRTEGPVQYITSAQVAKGVELSGKGFCEDCGTRSYEWREEDRVPEHASVDSTGGTGDTSDDIDIDVESDRTG